MYLYNGIEILFHWIFRGYRADTDLSVQQQFADESYLRSASRGRPRLSVVIAALSAWKVSVFSFECGGPTCWVGPGGTVVSADRGRSRWELQVSDRASAVANDADRVEFRHRDANNKMDFKYSRVCPWLMTGGLPPLAGPTLINTINAVHQQRARAEGPEQTEQFAQLAAVHAPWYHQEETRDPSSGMPSRLPSHVRGEARCKEEKQALRIRTSLGPRAGVRQHVARPGYRGEGTSRAAVHHSASWG